MDVAEGAEFARLSVNLNDESAAILRAYMAEHGVSATEALRRAVGLYGFVEEEQAKGTRFLTRTWWGRWRRLKFL